MMRGVSLVALVAAVVATNQIPGFGPRPQPGDPQLYITTDRLSYRLTQTGRAWTGTMIVRLTNYTNDTIYLRPTCAGGAPGHEFAVIEGEYFFPPGHKWGCMIAAPAGVQLENGMIAFAIAPNSSRRDTLKFGAEPFIRREESAPREGIARYKLRYTPYVKRGFLRKHWTIDQHVWLESDPFELITPGFER